MDQEKLWRKLNDAVYDLLSAGATHTQISMFVMDTPIDPDVLKHEQQLRIARQTRRKAA